LFSFVLLLKKTHGNEHLGFQLHVVGVTMHGGPYTAFAVSNPPSYATCANVTVTAIMRVLQASAKVIRNQPADNMVQFWPDTLHVQMDNCAKDNKNAMVFSFLGMLVARDHFKEITVGFLLVGHTHDEVDQMFSSFSR
jgi:hypothetical protein